MRRTHLVTMSLTVAALVVVLTVPSAAAGPLRPVDETVSVQDLAINAQLEGLGANVRLYSIEYVTAPGTDHYGGTIFARNVGNRKAGAHFVPYDPNRRGDRFITYAVDGIDLFATGGAAPADLEAAIDSAMATWNGVQCAAIPIVKVPNYGYDLGYVQWLLGFGGVPGWLADVTHAGWLPAAYFDAIAPGGSTYILGVTHTFIWTEGGVPTDIDGNGRSDVAFREIYYNNAFAWSVDGPAWNDPTVDVETIALHETGHGLSQGHFGKMFVDAGDKEPPYALDHLHFAPRAVMNAVYWDTQRELLGTDVGGHCAVWGSWPQR